MSLTARLVATIGLSLFGIAVLVASGFADQAGTAAGAVLAGGIWD